MVASTFTFFGHVDTVMNGLEVSYSFTKKRIDDGKSPVRASTKGYQITQTLEAVGGNLPKYIFRDKHQT